MKQICNKTVLAMVAIAALLLWGCTKDNTEQGGDSTPGREVSVTLPLAVTDAEPASAVASVATTSPAQATNPTSKATPSEMLRSDAATSEGFTVSFGEPTTDAPAIATRGNTATEANPASPATRTVAQELTNVWVLQFDASGAKVSTKNEGTLAAGAHFTPTLVTGTGCTIYVVANGPESGLDPATLADFETTMLATAAVTDATKLPLSGNSRA